MGGAGFTSFQPCPLFYINNVKTKVVEMIEIVVQMNIKYHPVLAKQILKNSKWVEWGVT